MLTQAAGNPLALVELSRAVAGDPDAVHRWASEPLPLTDRLREIFGAELERLPAPARGALLLAAVADAGDRLVARRAVGHLAADVWEPAEDAGLVSVTAEQGVAFRHPLVRSAVYASASFAQRQAAHREVAALIDGHPVRRAWHLAAATVHSDDAIAAALEAGAEESRRRGALLEASRALERAAHLSTDPEQTARRLVSAALAAHQAGDTAWVQELAEQARRTTDDPGTLRLAGQVAAAALATTLDHRAAHDALVASIRGALAADPWLALATLTTAAVLAQHTGDAAMREDVVELHRALRSSSTAGTATPPRTLTDRVSQAADLWVRTAVAPVDARDVLVADLEDALPAEPHSDHQMLLGAAALVLDETTTAVDLLSASVTGAAAEGSPSAAQLIGLGWACVARGRWPDALAAADQACEISTIGRQDLHHASALALEATIDALRGQVEQARERISTAVAAVDPRSSSGVTARLRYAAGLTATADGDHVLAFTELSRLFEPDGTPTHYHLSWYALADLVFAGVRAGLADETATVLDRSLDRLSGPLRPRLQRRVDRARALLAGPEDAAEAFFVRAGDSPAGEWPFELAQTRLDHGEWLRRRRRVLEARPLLESARQEFERLGARSWAERAHVELRAAGVRQDRAEDDAFSRLSAQQQQILQMAASGLTNKEIGERLYLSPRTVGSHLYRIFPLLGITTRAQLHGALPADDGSTGS